MGYGFVSTAHLSQQSAQSEMSLSGVSINSQRFIKLLERLACVSNRGQNAAQIMMGIVVIGTYAHRGFVVRYRLTVFALGYEGVAHATSGLRIVRADFHSFLVVHDRFIDFPFFLQKSVS